MTTTTIRVSLETRMMISELAQTTGVSIQELIKRAIDLYRRQQILAATNTAYAALQTDATSLGALQAEREEWDTTLADGLEKV